MKIKLTKEENISLIKMLTAITNTRK